MIYGTRCGVKLPIKQLDPTLSNIQLISICIIAIIVTALGFPYYHIVIIIAQGLFITSHTEPLHCVLI